MIAKLKFTVYVDLCAASSLRGVNNCLYFKFCYELNYLKGVAINTIIITYYRLNHLIVICNWFLLVKLH